MNTFNIVIDADDVLENLLIVWVNELNERYNLNYGLDDMEEWSMTKNIPELTEEEIFAPLHEDALWEKINTMPYAQKALQIFEDMGHEVYICTRHTIFETLRTKLFRLQELFRIIHGMISSMSPFFRLAALASSMSMYLTMLARGELRSKELSSGWTWMTLPRPAFSKALFQSSRPSFI